MARLAVGNSTSSIPKKALPLAIILWIWISGLLLLLGILNFGIAITLDRQNAQIYAETQVTLQLDLLEVTGVDELYKTDTVTLQDAMNALLRKGVIAGAAYYDSTGRIIAKAGSDPSQDNVGERFNVSPDPLGLALLKYTTDFYEWHTAFLRAGRPIYIGKDVIGAVSVDMPLDDYMADINRRLQLLFIRELWILVSGAVVAFVISRQIAKAIKQLSLTTHKISAGDLEQPVHVDGSLEIQQLANDFNQMQSRLKQTITDLKQAQVAADSANHAKSVFLATVSHELRTPLNGVIAFATLLRMGIVKGGATLTAEQIDVLDKIEANGKRLNTMINDILNLAKAESGNLAVTVSTDNPCTLVEDTVSSLRGLAIEKGLSLQINIDPATPTMVEVDADKLRQIVNNLVGNAIKFTKTGYVKVDLASHTKDTWQLSVIDTGIGIPAHIQANIFERFYQADGSEHRQYGGAGIGLATVRSYVELLGGKIELQSKVGEGSNFTVIFPRKLSVR